VAGFGLGAHQVDDMFCKVGVVFAVVVLDTVGAVGAVRSHDDVSYYGVGVQTVVIGFRLLKERAQKVVLCSLQRQREARRPLLKYVLQALDSAELGARETTNRMLTLLASHAGTNCILPQ
jgi:hypothetical protein